MASEYSFLSANKTKRSRSVCEAFGLWGLHIIPTLTWTTVRSVRWTPPRAGQWKLNVDGASQGNPGSSGGGGILRDSTGCILFAFSNFYNMQTNTVAEAMAIRDGLFLCEEQNITNIVLESDSKCSGHVTCRLLSSLEAQEYLGRHHAMSRTHHNYYASIPRRESDS
ncbi:unnamed protein product [Spirodela intermedia]|uniref:RNase H type-1 domain-containing protein n=1 Tax=Spirodela intermedia TaxID=51605 RepID=A0A7I8IBV3_SPIIN|nr:unnamed protein product [Spirodela intermedia]CAA2632005.1 unnamed protein product [Spirodela intermedia]CAA6655179.1 unnamed protein product [Spirodela intermedia]CAA6671238.1 unnamed protein product [Spirodela intermedia]